MKFATKKELLQLRDSGQKLFDDIAEILTAQQKRIDALSEENEQLKRIIDTQSKLVN